MIGNFALLAAVFAATAVGPGMVVCGRRRLRGWNPLERWCAAVAASLLVQYLIGLGVYAAGLADGWHYLGAAVGLAGTVLAGGDIVRLLKATAVRRAIWSYVAVFLAGLVMVATIRSFGGGEWFGDWVEHFQRTGFWLGKFPADYKFIGDYALPARPPMANVLCAGLLAQACPGGPYPYAVYQVALLMLCSLIALPVGLVTRRLWPRGGRHVSIAVGLLLLNPMFVQNLTYPWTRHLNTFFILTGLALYLSAVRKREATRMVAGFLCLTTAMLVHYSAGPWLLYVVLHYLLAVWPRRRGRLGELAAIVASCAVVLSTWVGWSVWTYGARVTFGANSVVADNAKSSAADNLAKVAGNFYSTLVPLPVRATPPTIARQGSTLGLVRDYAFATYQQNVLFALGSAGVVVTMLLLFKARRGWPERRFWIVLIPFVGFLGIAVNGSPDPYGQAHIILQPLVYAGVCLVAAGIGSLAAPWRVFLLAGAALDFRLGIYLQLRTEHLAGRELLGLSPATLSNAQMKLQAGVVFVGDRVGAAGGTLLVVLIVAWVGGTVWLARRLAAGVS